MATSSVASKKKKTSGVSSSVKSKCSSSFVELYKKELTDHLQSKRFYLAFALLFFVSVASLLTATSNLIESLDENSAFIFLQLFTTGTESVYSFASFIAYLGPLVGIVLGFDAINNERSQGTLNRLASQPIYRDSIINAKFLAGTTVISVIVLFLGLCYAGAGLVMIGIPPSLEEAARALIFLLLSVVYISFWLALATVFSVICKHAATAAIACIGLWLFLSMFMSQVIDMIVNALYPLEGVDGYNNILKNYTLALFLSRLSPYYLFVEASTTLLDPSIRSIGIVTSSQLESVISTPISLEQSLSIIWPHLVVMIGLAIVSFAVAYIKFMRQEIRA